MSKRKIEFVLRFSKKFDEHERMHKTYLELLKKFAKKYSNDSNKCKKIILYQVERLGFSGASVFYVIIENNNGSYDTRIAKFDRYSDIKNEAKMAKKFNEEIYGPYKYIDADDFQHGLLIYDEIDHGNEFHYLFLDESKNTENIIEVLEKLYKKLFSDFYKKSGNTEEKDILDDYQWYLDRKNKPLDKLKSISTYFKKDFKIKKIEKCYTNLEVNKPQVICTKIHGDLHARNILSNDRNVHLIDYAWVHKGHIAKDFTLLECTILHILLPEYMLKKTFTHIMSKEYEDFLHQIYDSFRLGKFKKISDDKEKNKVYRRAFETIKIIRKYARKSLKLYASSSFKNIFSEYKYSMFMMSLSQISFDAIRLEILLSTVTKILDNVDEVK